MAGAPRAHAQETGVLRGTVVASTDGRPVRDADVFVQGSGRRALTGQSGAFLIPGLRPGSYRLVVEALGFGSAAREVTVGAGEALELRIELEEHAMALPEVVVVTSRGARDLAEVAASVGVVDGARLRAANPGHPSDVMGQVPGVHVNVTGGEGHMTAIRQPLSTDPLYLYLEDGVPTRSTGFFNHNALYEVNLPQADRIEVMKGPANAMYGSDAVGGVINVGTRPPTQDPTGELTLERGEYGYARYLGTLSGTPGGHGLRLDGNFTRTDGWRDGTAYDRMSATLRWDRSLGSGTSIRTVVTWSEIDQNTAGSSALSREDFETNPRANYTPISFREVSAFRASSALELMAGAWGIELTPFLRWNRMDLLPNWSLSYDPAVWDTGHRSLGLLAKATWEPAGAPGRVTVGVDLDHSPGHHRERTIVPTLEGPIFTRYEPGARIYDYDVTFRQVAPYVQAELAATDRLHLSGGLRADLLGYDYRTHLPELQTGMHRRPADASPTFRAVSPKLGLTYQVARGGTVYASYRRGFRAPSEGQLFRQGRAESTVDLEPVIVDAYEIGARGRIGGRVRYEVAAYLMEKTDDIVGFRHPDGSTESMNAGETSHRGLEMGLGVELLRGLTAEASYSVARHEYDRWEPSGELDLSGREQELAPRRMGSFRLLLDPPSLPVNATLELRDVGSYWMDAANTNRYGGHRLLNLGASWHAAERFEVYARLSNLTDERYAEHAIFNEFRGQELAPGMPRTLYVGVKVR